MSRRGLAPLALAPAGAPWAVGFLALATLLGAHAFEALGYAPCELCLQQRWAYYLGIPLAAAVGLARGRARRLGLWALTLLFLGSAAFGAWHAGVEWGLWAGPAGCTGAVPPQAASVQDFRRALDSVRVVRCDAPALRILGLSLAGWNALVSLGLAAIAAAAARRS